MCVQMYPCMCLHVCVVCLWVVWVCVCSMHMRSVCICTSVCGCTGPRSLSWFVNLDPCPLLHHSAAGSSREGADPPQHVLRWAGWQQVAAGGRSNQMASGVDRAWCRALCSGRCSWPDTGCPGEGEARPAFWESGSSGLRGPVAGRPLGQTAGRGFLPRSGPVRSVWAGSHLLFPPLCWSPARTQAEGRVLRAR